MIDEVVLKRIAKNLGLDAELFAANPEEFLTEHEIGKVLKAFVVFELNGEVIYKLPGATIGLDPDDLEEPVTDTTPQPTVIADDDDMDGSPF
ncbi:hypothetical protein HVZ88_25490 (plasmid) [Escherichia coli]|nr:hypothetical protein HVZ88_25490 [Escherichia coli]